ncbi:hypothetical protein Q6316_29465, partial [Klebsiella pneumoniae]|uniref:hypothetical protein n=1 Tax=Klebsiella pneumoniae TaxID=573 RepID=UPI002730B40B
MIGLILLIALLIDTLQRRLLRSLMDEGMVKFCENGAKAVNWEATKRRVDAVFFAKHSVTALLEQSDYWLEYQGRLTEPMR